ncbi:hypothetical protein C8R45DRAFT_927669 [Mycena sanguinolenta]|nr:hypothetical protein C8R45DRAFT_927669 [Mycena sanguinolenta]
MDHIGPLLSVPAHTGFSLGFKASETSNRGKLESVQRAEDVLKFNHEFPLAGLNLHSQPRQISALNRMCSNSITVCVKPGGKPNHSVAGKKSARKKYAPGVNQIIMQCEVREDESAHDRKENGRKKSKDEVLATLGIKNTRRRRCAERASLNMRWLGGTKEVKCLAVYQAVRVNRTQFQLPRHGKQTNAMSIVECVTRDNEKKKLENFRWVFARQILAVPGAAGCQSAVRRSGFKLRPPSFFPAQTLSSMGVLNT